MKLIMTDRPVDVSFLKNEAVKYIDLSSLRIANCMGCFGCWTKTPGMPSSLAHWSRVLAIFT